MASTQSAVVAGALPALKRSLPAPGSTIVVCGAPVHVAVKLPAATAVSTYCLVAASDGSVGSARFASARASPFQTPWSSFASDVCVSVGTKRGIAVAYALPMTHAVPLQCAYWPSSVTTYCPVVHAVAGEAVTPVIAA